MKQADWTKQRAKHPPSLKYVGCGEFTWLTDTGSNEYVVPETEVHDEPISWESASHPPNTSTSAAQGTGDVIARVGDGTHTKKRMKLCVRYLF